MKKIILSQIFTLLVLIIQAQDVSNIDSLFTSLANENQFNGNVLILKGDIVLYEQSFGFADFEKGIKLDQESVFELASIGKLYTAVCIGILKDQGKLNFDDKVEQHIEYFPFAEITIRHLLNHTSGLPDYMDFFIENAPKGERIYNEDVLQFLSRTDSKLLFNAGDSIQYSNTGYVVLASIIEKTSGYSYDSFLEKFVWYPLDIYHSITTKQKYNRLISVNNYAFGYRVNDNGENVATNKKIDTNDIYGYGLRPIQGDGNIAGQIKNYAQFILALKDNRLLKKETFEEFLVPGKLNSGTNTDYGFGVYISDEKNEFYHTGSVPGYQSFFKHLSGQNITVVYVRNVESWNWSWFEAFNRMLTEL
jgi:CubicO group peptidase (beta-lactamase class C family)